MPGSFHVDCHCDRKTEHRSVTVAVDETTLRSWAAISGPSCMRTSFSVKDWQPGQLRAWTGSQK